MSVTYAGIGGWLLRVGLDGALSAKSARWNVESATEHELVELPSVALIDKRQLPDKPGVYFVLAEGRLQYVGLARQLDRRWEQHNKLPALRKMQDVRIAWIALPGTDLESLTELEAALISLLEPPLNGGGIEILQGGKKRFQCWLSEAALAELERRAGAPNKRQAYLEGLLAGNQTPVEPDPKDDEPKPKPKPKRESAPPKQRYEFCEHGAAVGFCKVVKCNKK